MKYIRCVTGLSVLVLLTLMGCGGPSRNDTTQSAIAIAVSPQSTSLGASETQQFTAQVSNTSNTAVTWSLSGCSGNACGTISQTGLYTAPSLIPVPATVRVVATSEADSTKSASATLTHVPLSVSIAEDTVSLGADQGYQFTATVTKHTNTAVTWSLTGCDGDACGTLTSSGKYTAPLSIAAYATVLVVATSQADSTKSDSVVVKHMPVRVSLSPPLSVRIVPGGAMIFAASVDFDSHNRGVTWSLGPSCSGAVCGALTNISPASVTYTAPLTIPDPAIIRLTATSITDDAARAEVAISVSNAPALKPGDYAFILRALRLDTADFSPNYPQIAIAGRFHANADGSITEGTQDMNLGSETVESVPFHGTYNVGADGRGAFTFTTAASEEFTYYITLDPSEDQGRFIAVDRRVGAYRISGVGYFALQDHASFALPSIAGPYAMALTGGTVTAIGRFDASTTGALTNGRADVGQFYHPDGAVLMTYPSVTLAGSFAAPDPDIGRGKATLTMNPAPGDVTATTNFAYYVISKDRILLVQTDPGSSLLPAFAGELRRQNGPFSTASLNAAAVLSLAGEAWFGMATTVGQMVPNGDGLVTGFLDEYSDACDAIDCEIGNKPFSGSYTIEADGRSVIKIQSVNPNDHIAYLFDQNQGFMVRSSGTTAGASILMGHFKQQDDGPFSAASLSGTFLSNSASLNMIFGAKSVGTITLDGVNAFTMSQTFDSGNQVESAGTYTVSANGRGILTFTSPSVRTQPFWVISPTEFVGSDVVFRK